MTGYFDFLFWFSSAILLFSTFTPVSCEHVTTSSTYYHGKYVLIYKLKISADEILIHILNVRVSDFQYWEVTIEVTILRSTHLINIYSFWNYLGKNLLLIRLIIVILFYLLSKDLRKKMAKQLNVIPQHNFLVSANQNPTIMITWK